MKDLEEQYVTVLDDFQHTVENRIRNHKDEMGFPQMPAGVNEEVLSDYLVAGILLCLPILVLSAFPDTSLPFKGVWNVLAAIAVGLVLFLIYRILMKAWVRSRIRRVNRDYPTVKEYVDCVLAFK